ncbi:uncharacterized protein TRUGW13939_05241 [Talaromyces rugulosus]|uniref:Ubiquitin-activating enzyme E1-like n=1 Tax=Talaromyces rugulosus TaxID=121627 RepID=A0A7H8QVR2_TALRU|nr:uncharacterized protein TRUGW13939_05241 [Talaromyces rugulosus]QKX58120.1 hypothetical protein TRUGW13939_05241 [Talaromyces rugulosus]
MESQQPTATQAAPRDAYLKRSLGTLSRRIRELIEWSWQSRVLLVGAGGIGCELLKNLVLTGFGEIHIIDLDTIDLSNLNRQFLFRHEHIKKPKALVAKEVAGKFRPDTKLEAYHANIKDAQFNIDWFKSFDLVFNALDNLDARRHVNRMCLAANVPLVESGTTGFNGQVQVIKKNLTECYDCNPKETPKTFPVCTIRSTPSQPIHCIVELFGTSETDGDQDGFDHSEDSENAEEIENLRHEAQALKTIRASIGSEDFAQKVFDKVFKDDIARLRSMDDMWKTRKPPTALDYKTVLENASDIDASVSQNDQKVWTTEEDLVVFKDSLNRLGKRLKELQENKDGDLEPVITFDKDDVDTLDFVAASANLRSVAFGIDTKSKFEIKQMAGNIIPAIATTNAMTAGLCVLQAFKVLKDDYEHSKMVFLERSGVRAINTDSLRPPNPYCAICSVAQGQIFVDLEHATLNDLVENVIRSKLNYGDEFSINTDAGMIYDPDLDDNLPKKLTELGVKAESLLVVIDEKDEEPFVNVELAVVERAKPTPEKSAVSLAHDIQISKKPPQKPPSEEPLNGTAINGATGKRKRDDEKDGLDGAPDAKRLAQGNGESNEPIVLDDPETGAILIDD